MTFSKYNFIFYSASLSIPPNLKFRVKEAAAFYCLKNETDNWQTRALHGTTTDHQTYSTSCATSSRNANPKKQNLHVISLV